MSSGKDIVVKIVSDMKGIIMFCGIEVPGKCLEVLIALELSIASAMIDVQGVQLGLEPRLYFNVR